MAKKAALSTDEMGGPDKRMGRVVYLPLEWEVLRCLYYFVDKGLTVNFLANAVLLMIPIPTNLLPRNTAYTLHL